MSENQWHLSKSIPISIIIGFIAQFAGAIWMFSTMYNDIETNTRRIDQHERKIEAMRVSTQVQAVQLGRIETSIDAMRKSLESLTSELRGR